MTKRIKISGPTIKTREQAIAAVAEIRDLTLQRNQAALKREAARKQIDDQYGPEIEELDEAIKAKGELVANWADANPQEFAKGKSIDLVHAIVGWRFGQFKLVKKTRAKWDDLVATVKEMIGADYIRTSEEVNKERIISGYNVGSVVTSKLNLCKLEVVQDEDFFIEPKIEETPNRITREAA